MQKMSLVHEAAPDTILVALSEQSSRSLEDRPINAV